MVLMMVEGRDGPPTPAAAAKQLGVDVGDIDSEFGVVLVDPRQSLYCVEVPPERLPQSDAASEGAEYRGPFSNPKIEPFGIERPPPEGEQGSPESGRGEAT